MGSGEPRCWRRYAGPPPLLALYRLLGVLAAGGPGRPTLLAWARPWRGTYARPRARKPGTLLLPGYARFAWGHGEQNEEGGANQKKGGAERNDDDQDAQDEEPCGEYLLLPDLATAPLRAWQDTRDCLFACHTMSLREGRTLPVLLIATNAGRAAAWRGELDERRAARRDVPLPAHVVTWEGLDADIRRVVALTGTRQAAGGLGRRTVVAPLAGRPPDRPLPRLVGGDLARGIERPPRATPAAAPRRGRGGERAPEMAAPSRPAAGAPLALALCPCEWELLDLIARHPFLPRDRAARALGWSDAALRRHRADLLRRGLVRLAGADELGPPYRAERAVLALVGRHPSLQREHLAALSQGGGAPDDRDRLPAWHLPRVVARAASRADAARVKREQWRRLAARQLAEATPAGLAALAARQGLAVAAAVRLNGLAGGGPTGAVGARASLLAALDHTLGVDALFVDLAHGARAAARRGADEALVEWRNAAACARRWMRPDGYGVYRRGADRYGFFLEYDRGTVGRRDWARKVAAYYDYRDGGHYRRDYDGFPTILIVVAAADAAGEQAASRAVAAEERIARTLRDAGVGRSPLPVRLTTEARVRGDPRGFLGPIWRTARSAERQSWTESERPARSMPTSTDGRSPLATAAHLE